jgi:IS30 family transposase
MDKNYNHLEFEERMLIGLLLGAGLSIRSIALEIERSPSTVSREIHRNSLKGEYQSRRSEQKSLERLKNSRRIPRLKNSTIRDFVKEKIALGWSPELIAGRLSLDHAEQSISHEAIYQYIYKEEVGLIPFLAQARKQRRRRRYSKNFGGAHIPQRTSIELRPVQVAQRTEPGHWEVDTALSTKNGKAAFLVVTERKFRFTRIAKLPAKQSKPLQKALIKLLAGYPVSMRKSLTYDNGSENTGHLLVNNALGTNSFFCHPYHSWEKGTVENTISLIRKFLKKQRNLDTVSAKQVRSIEDWINNRPKKCLGFRTPREMLNSTGVALTH